VKRAGDLFASRGMLRGVCVFYFLALWAATAFAAPVAAPAAKLAKPTPDAPERMEMTRVQIFLDRAGFRPGKIDGLGGEFTQRAADRWCDSAGVPRGSMLDLSGVPGPYRDYTVQDEDADWVGPTASQPAAQAKLKALLYGSLWEAVAERFHCDLNFLRELNPDVGEIVVGTVVRVPDVEEFRMEDVKALQKARAQGAATPTPSPMPTPERVPDLSEPVQAPSPADFFEGGVATASPTPAPEPVRRLVLVREERLIELYEDDRIAGCFPCTPGSAKFPVPEGIWKVTSNILMPNFRWDKSVLETGVRSENAYILPPGPNSPVGIVWMGINRPSLGMHGTNTPDRIGRNESSGCIRLANWDAFRLCQLVKKGTPLEVR
jgi:lipoprotein-anchoring transpeptidase ErfK/SrfK